MMASDDKKTKAEPAPKTEAPPKSKSTADAKSTSDVKSTADAAPGKAEGGAKEAGSSAAYHRGEGQKPVSQAYRDNWNLIFGEKKKR
jgi:hypothetical protein